MGLCMLKGILTAAVILAAVPSAWAQWGSSGAPASAPNRVEASAAPPSARVTNERGRPEIAAEPVITQGQIASFKSVLKLRPEQHPHWATVETALHDIARGRSSAVAETTTKLRRLKALAAPLIKSLDNSQRSDAIAFARRIGYGQLAASF
jgi:hypothetical protein